MRGCGLTINFRQKFFSGTFFKFVISSAISQSWHIFLGFYPNPFFMRIQLHILAGVLLFLNSLPAGAQTFLWNRTVKSEGFDEAYDLATDPAGNVYVAGMIEYESDFGNGLIIESRGVHDIFIAKYDSTGNLIWARSAGGRDGDKVQSITLTDRVSCM
jgi:hypothetical protein